MFELIQEAPRDPILGLTEAFRSDNNPHKINLSVGVYQDDRGRTPTLTGVREAERRLAEGTGGKAYLPIDGDPEYGHLVQQLLFGTEHEALTNRRSATSHTPGGTGALRVVADFLHANLPSATVWLSEPTWPNHPSIFSAADVATKTYPYYDELARRVDFPAFAAALRGIPAGDVVLLHACCHNPTGADLTPDQWHETAAIVRERRLVPLLDFAYQGFADGLDEDAAGLRALVVPGQELFVCSSFSKNFGLYRERVGALTVVAADADRTRAVQSQIKRSIRANYSNPPAHGGAIVQEILADQELRLQWIDEVTQMRSRINGMRKLFVEKLREHRVPGEWDFMTRQRGMFSYSGLSPTQVDELRARHSIYIVRSGRINVAGITPDNVDRLCEAIGHVVGGQ
jgi:aspartate/tyrosine/aromatic aminotransferase